MTDSLKSLYIDMPIKKKPIDGKAKEALELALKKSGKNKPTLSNRR
jgi:hypothetical protein